MYPDQKPMPLSRRSTRKPTLVGHRGASGLAPENTLAAFHVAAQLGIDGIEFDVQRSADGHLVVFHDETLERTSNGTGTLAAMSLADLQALDAGSWFDSRFAGERIPTLAEVFDHARHTDLLLFIELKDPHHFPGMEGEVAALIRQFDLVERVQVRSFYHEALHRFHQIAPEIAVSELWFHAFPEAGETHFLTLDMLGSLCTPETIAAAHGRGQQVTAWTVNELEQAQTLIAAGIDSLTTDYPDRLLSLF